MDGRRIVLDPGHNGANARHPEIINRLVEAGGFKKPCNTTGTSTNAGYAEHAFTYDVAVRAAGILRGLGATVTLTRPDDKGVGPCVDRRARIANSRRAEVVVSIHADGASARARGFHVIEPALAPDKGNRRILTSSDGLARALRASFSSVTGLPRATYPGGIREPGLARRSDLAGLNLARQPAAMIECGNMRNSTDARFLSSGSGRGKVARAVAEGVLAYLGAER
ncbi:N-acetylmuramoyl-L-alanine amidase [Motilibacter sp. E257]|uniref:N-acetylmuramoyl-L-alanine amidase n=1 Tax=Motilibacter deserti TaxID=2714956 RepID=A0ABX0GWC5_9ACTN|nr:N-acetylmuramoyl-L-alanine amidase [Motilibacter deserti]NHC13996.1 N-acetylmuramoyl-L-alanine amidase [Motilibacter deserti]